jgi:hypothetical protein
LNWTSVLPIFARPKYLINPNQKPPQEAEQRKEIFKEIQSLDEETH